MPPVRSILSLTAGPGAEELDAVRDVLRATVLRWIPHGAAPGLGCPAFWPPTYPGRGPEHLPGARDGRLAASLAGPIGAPAPSDVSLTARPRRTLADRPGSEATAGPAGNRP